MSDCAWYKGNLHTHTTESDGDADPEFVVNWFMEHGYDFLVLSDHNHRTILEHEVEGGPLMIPGEEVSARIEVRLHTDPYQRHRYLASRRADSRRRYRGYHSGQC